MERKKQRAVEDFLLDGFVVSSKATIPTVRQLMIATVAVGRKATIYGKSRTDERR
jgi:hypothetical protein